MVLRFSPFRAILPSYRKMSSAFIITTQMSIKLWCGTLGKKVKTLVCMLVSQLAYEQAFQLFLSVDCWLAFFSLVVSSVNLGGLCHMFALCLIITGYLALQFPLTVSDTWIPTLLSCKLLAFMKLCMLADKYLSTKQLQITWRLASPDYQQFSH